MNGAMDTLVFSVVLILVILAFFIVTFVAVAAEERRQRRVEGDRYAPPVIARTASVPVSPPAPATAPPPMADARAASFVPAP